MNRISRNISIILRAERLIAQRRFAVLRTQTAMIAFAGIVAGLGLIMLNAAAYFALAGEFPRPVAALIVAVVNMALAGVLVSTAGRINADTEVASAVEVRDLAIEDLEAEAEAVTVEARELADNLRRLVKDPLGTAAPGLLAPLLSMLLQRAKK